MNSIREAVKQIEVGWKSQKIRLVGTSLSQEEFTLLKETLATHPSVKSLEICLCELSEEEIVEFAKSMQDFSLIGLQLVHVGLGENGAQALATAVQECALKKLDLAFNRIGPAGARALAGALKDCGLESLLLGKNEIGGEGATWIAETLAMGGTSLKTLDLSKNRIGDAGVLALAKALPVSALDTLLMDADEITHKGVVALCEALKQSPHVFNLSLGGNKLKDESVIELAKTLKYTKLERLSLNANDFGHEALVVLAEAIKDSQTLEVLDIKQNRHIRNASVDILLRNVRTHRTLKTVVLDGTSTTQAKREEMQKHLVNLHGERAKLMTVLCSVRLPRIGIQSSFKILSSDLVRSIANMIA
jgi:Ran GTPase-activating protein (RanGAP) involved in mRNA processing and transport